MERRTAENFVHGMAYVYLASIAKWVSDDRLLACQFPECHQRCPAKMAANWGVTTPELRARESNHEQKRPTRSDKYWLQDGGGCWQALVMLAHEALGAV